MNQKDKLLEATIKALTEGESNPYIYKIVLKDDTVMDKEFTDLKTAQKEAEKLDAKNVKGQYKDNSVNELFNEFVKKECFIKNKWYKYENDKFFYEDNSGWREINEYEKDCYKMSINLPPYILGRLADPYYEEDYKTYIIVDTNTGNVYEYEDVSSYTSIKELKQGLQEVLNGVYGERLYIASSFDPFDFLY